MKIFSLIIFSTLLSQAGIFTPFLAKRALAHGENEKALSLYQELLAEKNHPDHYQAALGKATAHYRLGDFEKAREAYSQALESSQQNIREAAHQGLGNTLFQLGWKKLGNETPYPANPEQGKAEFQKSLAKKLEQWGKDKIPAGEQSETYLSLKSIATDWSDSVRHHQSALATNTTLDTAAQNEQVSRTYLKKLLDALQEIQGNGAAGEDEGESTNSSDGEGDPDKEGKGRGEGNKEKEKDGNGDQQKNKGPGKDEKTDANNKYGADKRQGESPAERALRKLKENSDMQEGISAPGEVPFRRPKQDW